MSADDDESYLAYVVLGSVEVRGEWEAVFRDGGEASARPVVGFARCRIEPRWYESKRVESKDDGYVHALVFSDYEGDGIGGVVVADDEDGFVGIRPRPIT
jgi:hypothetical protein